MECSTTELRQHAPDTRIGPKRTLQSGPILATSPSHAQARERSAGWITKNGRNQRWTVAVAFHWAHCGPIRFPISFASPGSSLIGLVATSNSMNSDDVEFDEVDPPELPYAGLGGKFQTGVPGAGLFSGACAFRIATRSNGSTMKDDRDKPDGRTAKDLRQDRLKIALRENLKRRKLQARGRGDIAAAPPDAARPSLHDERETKSGE